ncbi:hypothetical protein [Capsulimonas corticalis]|uniref:hypothetical protein n=1 Tax=Capsulimonas corticalis TaxID=2219043 RepID=UPI000E65D2D6|nr:hypothetical protein [Capsulimonas corticalis]
MNAINTISKRRRGHYPPPATTFPLHFDDPPRLDSDCYYHITMHDIRALSIRTRLRKYCNYSKTSTFHFALLTTAPLVYPPTAAPLYHAMVPLSSDMDPDLRTKIMKANPEMAQHARRESNKF